MSVSTPNPVSLITLLGKKCSLISVSNRECSPSPPASTTNSLEATSNTGDTLPFHVGMAIFMFALCKVCLSASFSASSLTRYHPYTHHDMGRNRYSCLVENKTPTATDHVKMTSPYFSSNPSIRDKIESSCSLRAFASCLRTSRS